MIKTTYEKQRNHPDRKSFSKIGGTFSLPNLIEIQTASFDWFLKQGLNEVFEDIFPIDNGKGLSLEYLGCYFEEPKFSETDCKNRDMDFSRPLRAELRLNNNGALYIVIKKSLGANSAIKKLQELFTNVEVIEKDKGYFIIKSFN